MVLLLFVMFCVSLYFSTVYVTQSERVLDKVLVLVFIIHTKCSSFTNVITGCPMSVHHLHSLEAAFFIGSSCILIKMTAGWSSSNIGHLGLNNYVTR